MHSTDMQLAADGAAAVAARQALKLWQQARCAAQEAPVFQCKSMHCSRRSWTVLKQLCSSQLLFVTGSAMQMRRRKLGIP